MPAGAQTNAHIHAREACAREHVYALRFECALRSTADESFRSNALAIREKHAFADFYALLAARALARVHGTQGEEHLTRIVNDAFRKRRDENVRVGQHSIAEALSPRSNVKCERATDDVAPASSSLER